MTTGAEIAVTMAAIASTPSNSRSEKPPEVRSPRPQVRDVTQPQPHRAKRLEWVQLAGAFVWSWALESGSLSSVAALLRVDKLHALHTLRAAVRFFKLPISLTVNAFNLIT